MKTNDANISEQPKDGFAPDVLKQAAQRELAAGVLKQAAHDLRRFHGTTSKVEREIYVDAYCWVTADERSSPFSFVNVCRLLNLAPDVVRDQLVDDLSLGAFSYWTRRCGRAAGRLQTSLSRFFVNERISHDERDMVLNSAGSAA